MVGNLLRFHIATACLLNTLPAWSYSWCIWKGREAATSFWTEFQEITTLLELTKRMGLHKEFWIFLHFLTLEKVFIGNTFLAIYGASHLVLELMQANAICYQLITTVWLFIIQKWTTGKNFLWAGLIVGGFYTGKLLQILTILYQMFCCTALHLSVLTIFFPFLLG